MHRAFVIMGLVFALAGCKKEVKVYVECVAQERGALCSVTHKQGKEPAGACWDVKVACANGASVAASGCQNVQPEGKTSLLIPESQFKGGQCDRATGFGVENVKVGPVLTALPTQEAAPANAPAADYLVIPGSEVELLAPPNWVRKKIGEWGLLGSPDKKALLAFVTFSNPGESTAKLGEVANVLGATGIKWGTPKQGNIGPDNFPARLADGSCTFGGEDGEIS
jgi:hypothetical protein